MRAWGEKKKLVFDSDSKLFPIGAPSYAVHSDCRNGQLVVVQHLAIRRTPKRYMSGLRKPSDYIPLRVDCRRSQARSLYSSLFSQLTKTSVDNSFNFCYIRKPHFACQHSDQDRLRRTLVIQGE